MKKKITAVVLAAGKSKRIKTALPKVLLDLAGQPMILYILKTLISIKSIDDIIVVLGHRKDLIKKTVSGELRGIKFSYQKQLNGTAKAVESAKSLLKGKDNLLVLCADTPLVTAVTLKDFIKFFFKKNADCAIITSFFREKNDYGRIVRDNDDRIKGITEKVEINDTPDSEEVNSGIYCFKKEVFFDDFKNIKINKKKKEFFLTDIIEIMYRQGRNTAGFNLDDGIEVMGVNTQKNLSRTRKIINQRFIDSLMNKGVAILDPETTFVSFNTKIGKDSVVYPFTFIEKNVIIGSNCELGPFIHLRKDSIIKNNTKVGNFVEINRSILGDNVRMKHFGYLGDTQVHESVNIGAGTVVANYDGKKKHKTVIKKNAFIGSDTVIVAPVTIGKAAATGAGSVVTKNVKDKTIVIGVPARVLRKDK